MKTKFHEKLIEERRDLVGQRVWFCPTKYQQLECIINDDGTVSVTLSPDHRFETAGQLITAISAGLVNVDTDFKLPGKKVLSNCSFVKNLYFLKTAEKPVYYYITNPVALLPVNEPSSSGTQCLGFMMSKSILKVLDHIKCSSIKRDGVLIRSRYCSRYKTAKSEMCKECSRGRSVVRRVIRRAKERKVVCPGVGDL